MNNSFLLLAKLGREMQVIQENSLDLLIGQLHVELLIVDPLGAYNWLGVLVGLQLLRVVVELQQLVSSLQLGIPGHLAWKKVLALKSKTLQLQKSLWWKDFAICTNNEYDR